MGPTNLMFMQTNVFKETHIILPTMELFQNYGVDENLIHIYVILLNTLKNCEQDVENPYM